MNKIRQFFIITCISFVPFCFIAAMDQNNQSSKAQQSRYSVFSDLKHWAKKMERQPKIPEYSVCYGIKKLDPKGPDADYQQTMQAIRNQNFTLADCIDHVWREKEKKQLKKIEDQLPTQEIKDVLQQWVKFRDDLIQKHYILDPVCDKDVPTEICKHIKDIVNNAQTNRLLINSVPIELNISSISYLKRANLAIMGNYSPARWDMVLTNIKKNYAVQIDLNFFQHSMPSVVQGCINHELCHMLSGLWLASFLQNSKFVAFIAKEDYQKLSRIEECHADLIPAAYSSKNADACLAGFQFVAKKSPYILQDNKYKKIDPYHPLLTTRLAWAERMCRLTRIEEKLKTEEMQKKEQVRQEAIAKNKRFEEFFYAMT